MNSKPNKNNLPRFVVVCQNIRSLFNVGSIFRVADCFGVNKVYLTGITGRPPRAEISKVALGAENYVPWEYHKQPARLLKQLSALGYEVVALEQVRGKSIDLNKFKPRFPVALLLGY